MQFSKKKSTTQTFLKQFYPEKQFEMTVAINSLTVDTVNVQFTFLNADNLAMSVYTLEGKRRVSKTRMKNDLGIVFRNLLTS